MDAAGVAGELIVIDAHGVGGTRRVVIIVVAVNSVVPRSCTEARPHLFVLDVKFG
ncbi:hypothetical protein D3C78_1548580 [compost metagenome]